jgi:hypothetical protein
METRDGTRDHERVLELVRHVFEEDLKRLDEIEATMRWRLEFRREAAEELDKAEETIRRMSSLLSELPSRLDEAWLRRDRARVEDLRTKRRLASELVAQAKETRARAAATLEENGPQRVYSEADARAVEVGRAAANLKESLEVALSESSHTLHERARQVRERLATYHRNTEDA